MILCDTSIFIYAFNGRAEAVSKLNTIDFDNILLSSITVMELLQGMGNKTELAQMKKKIAYYDVIQIDTAISEKAIYLIEKYKLSHGLEIPDAIIAATSVEYEIPLFTYNVKDFNFIPKLVLY